MTVEGCGREPDSSGLIARRYLSCPASFLWRANYFCWLLALLVVAGFSSSSASAHALHLSLAEADFRAESGKLEIAVRVFSDDFEVALSRRVGQKITVERTPSAELDRLLAEYVRSTFLVKTRDGTPVAFTWIGHELKDADQHLWLYFEGSLPSGIEGTRFAHRVLRDIFADQLNSVIVRDHPSASSAEKKPEPTRQLTLLFPDDQERVVKFPK